MTQHPFWRRSATKILLNHPRLTVVEDAVTLPNGAETSYMRYEGLPDYVTVLAVRNDGKLAFIKEYSYPHDEWLWQFPEGSIEQGESAESTAVRELREEAGLVAGAYRQLGMNYSHHRRSTEKNYIFLATDAHEAGRIGGDIEEQGTELHWFELSEVIRTIAEGDIVQKNALAALALYLAHTGGDPPS